jgi:glutamate-1-semialdehyde 2,1-aminomutase
MLNTAKLQALITHERATYNKNHPKSLEAYNQAVNLFGKVPMTWMNKWAGGFPIYLDKANCNKISDIDGHHYIDFALGDTGAMSGHSPHETVKSIE